MDSGKINKSNQSYDFSDFEVWINDDCKTRIKTNEQGLAKFHSDKITSLQIAYNDYEVKYLTSNYFILTLSDLPLLASPPELLHTCPKRFEGLIRTVKT
jgi:hypothetical protein